VKRPGPLVEIRWTDALNLPDSWSTRKAARKSRPMPTVTVGYVLKETRRYITVAALVNENHVANGITIPFSCIRQVRRLSQ